MNYARLFEDCAERNSGKNALLCGSRRITYEGLSASSSRFANALGKLGFARQDKLAILAKNNIQCVEVMLACFKADIIACPINTRLSSWEVAVALSGDEVSGVAFDSGSLEHARHLRSALPPSVTFIALDETGACEHGALSFDELVGGASDRFEIVEAREGDIALELFTSGTTGLPKAVLHSHRKLSVFMAMFGFAARHGLAQRSIPTDDVILGLLSLHHVSGLSTLYGLMSGATVVLLESFAIEAFLDAIQRYRVTRTTVPSTVVEWMLDRDDLASWDLSSLVEVSYGGSPISPHAVLEAARALNCTLTQAYGSTESLIVTVLSGRDHLEGAERGDQRVFSAGKPLVGVDVKVVDADGARCAVGEEGEIVVMSPSSMEGYRGMSRGESGFDAEGWLRMGDLGYLDENGFVYVTGRKHDLIISGGENVYPHEVERCIALLEEDVDAVAVAGVPHPKWGETPVAFVVRKSGSSVNERSIIAHCESRIARFKRPSAVVFLEALPKDSLGKVLREDLVRSYCGSGECVPRAVDGRAFDSQSPS